MSYNGWTNYETWCVNLANSSETDYKKVQQLRETIEQLTPLGKAWLEIINAQEDEDLDDKVFELIA